EPCRSPSIICTWHWRRLDILLVAKLRYWGVPFQRFVALTYPVESCRSIPGALELPCHAGRQKREATFTEMLSLSINLYRYRSFENKHEALDFCLRLRIGGTAARRDFKNKLGEGGSTASHRSVQNPSSGVLPFGQNRRDNIAQYPLGNNRIGLGDYRSIGKKLCLWRMTTMRSIALRG